MCNIVSDRTCKSSNYPFEDLSHTFINCPSLFKWWNTYLPCIKIFENTSSCFNVVIEYIQKLGNEDIWPTFFTIVWFFCGRRNKLVYKDLHIHPQEAVEHAFSLFVAYKDCNSRLSNRSKAAWTPPFMDISN